MPRTRNGKRRKRSSTKSSIEYGGKYDPLVLVSALSNEGLGSIAYEVLITGAEVKLKLKKFSECTAIVRPFVEGACIYHRILPTEKDVIRAFRLALRTRLLQGKHKHAISLFYKLVKKYEEMEWFDLVEKIMDLGAELGLDKAEESPDGGTPPENMNLHKKPVLSIHEPSCTVICQDKNTNTDCKFKVTAPQEFAFLCILAKKAGEIVDPEEIANQLISILSLDNSTMRYDMLPGIKKHLKNKFKQNDVPEELFDTIMYSAGKQGYILDADVTFSISPL